MGLALALCAASFLCGCFGGYVAAVKGRPVFEGLIFGAVLFVMPSSALRTKPSPSLFRSTEERRSPESCSSFRSREQPHAGFITVVLGCRT